MGKPGRKTKPAAIHRRRGTDRKDRHKEPTKTPAAGTVPKPPAVLSPAAKKHWKNLAAELVARGLLTTLDLSAFALYCEALAEYWLHKAELVKTEDYVDETSNGNTIQHPRVGMANQAAKRVADFGARFGLTPSDRTGLIPGGSAPPAAGDAFFEYINRRERITHN